jgi:hypothetical protein
MNTTNATPVPADWPVQPIDYAAREQFNAKRLAVCGTCGRMWDDGKVTSMTPAPSGRCPFEPIHGVWTDYECHFEVIVSTDAAGTVSPRAYLNDENSATWWDGTVYATNDEGDGDWIAADDAPADDAAAEHLSRVLALPDKIIDTYRRWTDGDGWDINIMSDIMGFMVELGYTEPECDE